MQDFRQEFIAYAVARNVLRFGEFKTKAGRLSPYFFNAGLFNDGEAFREKKRKKRKSFKKRKKKEKTSRIEAMSFCEPRSWTRVLSS